MKKEEGEQNVSSPEVRWANDEERMEMQTNESAFEAEVKIEENTVTYEGADDETAPLPPPQVKHEDEQQDQDEATTKFGEATSVDPTNSANAYEKATAESEGHKTFSAYLESLTSEEYDDEASEDEDEDEQQQTGTNSPHPTNPKRSGSPSSFSDVGSPPQKRRTTGGGSDDEDELEEEEEEQTTEVVTPDHTRCIHCSQPRSLCFNVQLGDYCKKMACKSFLTQEGVLFEELADVTEASIQESYVRAYKSCAHFYVSAVTETFDTEPITGIRVPRCMIFGTLARAFKTFHAALELEDEATSLRAGTVHRFMLVGRDNYMAEEEATGTL